MKREPNLRPEFIAKMKEVEKQKTILIKKDLLEQCCRQKYRKA